MLQWSFNLVTLTYNDINLFSVLQVMLFINPFNIFQNPSDEETCLKIFTGIWSSPSNKYFIKN